MDDEMICLVSQILGLEYSSNRISTLQIALQSARFYCGYTGRKDYSEIDFANRQGFVDKTLCKCNTQMNSEIGDLFSAMLIYLNSLEQIGDLFCKGDDSGIVNALKKYAKNELCDDEISALKYLRHSFAHSFGLLNIGKHNYKYSLVFKDGKKIVELPPKMWDGNTSDKSDSTTTKVYIFPFIRMVENIIEKCQQELRSNVMKCNFKDIEDVKARYTVII